MSFEIIRCWNHSNAERPPYPVMRVEYKHVTERRAVEVDTKVDTGFFGTVTVDRRVVQELSLPIIGRDIVVTATELVEVELFPVKISIPELKIKDEVFLAYRTRGCLLGRSLLMGKRWLLDNIENTFCLIEF